MNHLKLTPSTLVNPKVETLTDFLKYFVNEINGTEIMQILKFVFYKLFANSSTRYDFL